MDWLQVLAEITKDMDLPHNSLGDLRWLKENLYIKNRDHPNYKTAMDIIQRQLEREG